MKKIAVPTQHDSVDDHFGHCAYYTIYTIGDNQITDKSLLPSPQGCGCKSNIAFDLQKMGVTVMLAGNMGEGAKNKLESCGIQVIRGCSGSVEEVIKDYMAGKISDSGSGCHAHDGAHQCSHTHHQE